MYVKKGLEVKYIIVSIYIDDLLVTENDDVRVFDFKKEMKKALEMSDLWELSYFFAMEIHQSNKGIFIS